MKITGSVTLLSFEADEYSKTLREHIERNFRQAVRAFLRAAIPLVPVDTGMARGSFLNIARFLRVALPISPRSYGKIYYAPGGRRMPKTPESGAALSTAASDVIRNEGGVLKFRFRTKVLHYQLNDFYGSHGAAPWGSFEAGRDAFMASLQASRGKLPKIGGFIIRTTYNIEDGNVIRQNRTVS